MRRLLLATTYFCVAVSLLRLRTVWTVLSSAPFPFFAVPPDKIAYAEQGRSPPMSTLG
jgi:hypothetical protein